MKALRAGLVVSVVAGSIGIVTGSTGCFGPSQVRQIYMALDGQGFRPRNIFYPDTSSIYCDVTFSASSNDETVDAIFTQTTGEATLYDGTNNLQPVSRLWATGEQAPNEGVSTLSFAFNPPQLSNGGSPAPFAVGHYQCQIIVNGADGGHADFDIQYADPDCPVGGAANSTLPCMGNKAGAQCPSDDSFGNGSACTCPSVAQVGGDPTLRMWVCTP